MPPQAFPQKCHAPKSGSGLLPGVKGRGRLAERDACPRRQDGDSYQIRNHQKVCGVVVVAEGAKPIGGEITVANTRNNGVGVDNTKLGGVGQIVAKQLEELTGLEARNTTLGYMQRGGTPTAFDRVLSTKYGSKAMELALEGKFGVLAVLKDGKLDSVSLEDVVGNNTKIGAVSGNTAESNIRRVTMDHDLVKTARNIGISLGD